MFAEVEKYEKQGYKLRISKREAEALGLTPGMIIEIPTVKIIRKTEATA